MTASLGGSLHSSFRSILHGGRARGQWKPNVETGESRNGQNSVMSDAAESSLASAEIWQRDRDQVPYEAYRRVFEHTGDDVVSVNSEETLSPRARAHRARVCEVADQGRRRDCYRTMCVLQVQRECHTSRRPCSRLAPNSLLKVEGNLQDAGQLYMQFQALLTTVVHVKARPKCFETRSEAGHTRLRSWPLLQSRTNDNGARAS